LLISSVNPMNIEANLRRFTKDVHISGTDANKKVAYDIAQKWNDIGLEDVHMIPYEVLLSYPDFTVPNTITIEDAQGKRLFKSVGVSPVILPDEQAKRKMASLCSTWLAYSASGRVTAEVVYCNRGQLQDFENLKRMKVDLKVRVEKYLLQDQIRDTTKYLVQRCSRSTKLLIHSALKSCCETILGQVPYWKASTRLSQVSREYRLGWIPTTFMAKSKVSQPAPEATCIKLEGLRENEYECEQTNRMQGVLGKKRKVVHLLLSSVVK
uniref:SEC63 domain-containing protein n=1 Tax=Angiostrongylus cantonensis TaxID=6313 RepID=A0A0K0D2X9_ANGCA